MAIYESKQAYLDALQRALTGLPPEAASKTMAYYEQRFIDGQVAGRSEFEIARDLEDPTKIAVTLRASTHLSAFEQKRNPANAVRMIFSLMGLAIFNLFMVVPAAVYAALLTALYACAFAAYVGGIAITASGMSGANELVLDGPLRQFVLNDDAISIDDMKQTRVTIGEMGINVSEEPSSTGKFDSADGDDTSTRKAKRLRRAEAKVGSGIHISTDMDAGSRTTQTFFGLAMVLGGIILMLLSLVVTKYTFIGIKRYIEMNLSLLRGY